LLRLLGGGGRDLAIHAATATPDPDALARPEIAAFYEKYPNSRYLRSEPVIEFFAPARVAVPA
jgi:hypothetical protein